MYFGFFEGMNYGNCKEKFEAYKTIKNKTKKSDILDYIKNLPIAAVAPMTTRDVFDGEPIEQAGIVVDGNFTFPTDFVHYYEKYNIGIPLEYENYILNK